MTVKTTTWVRRRARGKSERGFVTHVEGQRALVRWLGAGKGEWVGKRSIVEGRPPRILVLEGSLDAELHSTRSERDALSTWCAANYVKLAFKTVHRVEDLEIIARSIGRDAPPFLHISCHGNHDDDKRAHLFFAPQHAHKHRIYLDDDETARAFRVFEGASLFLSACEVGKYGAQVSRFKRAAKLRHVAAFSREVYDHEMLYHSSLNLGLTFPKAVERASKAVAVLGVKGNQGKELVRVF